MQKQILISESYEKNEDKYERGNHHVGISMWEFEWCPKYRYKMFRNVNIKSWVKHALERQRRSIKLNGLN